MSQKARKQKRVRCSMIVDLEPKTEQGKFALSGGGEVELRLLSADDIKAMRKACIENKTEYPLLDIDPNDPTKGRDYRQFERVQFNSELWDEMRWDRTIVGWSGIGDKNGNPIPVTTENKVLLMTRVVSFVEDYEKGMAALKEAEAKRLESTEKNSLIG